MKKIMFPFAVLSAFIIASAHAAVRAKALPMQTVLSSTVS